MSVPNTFASATSSIPLANLDANFAYYDAAFAISGSAVTFAGSITLTTGTANGVPYLNASKVLTSGAVLTFDGTTLSSTKFAGALNGTVGATTPATGVFTSLNSSGIITISIPGTGIPTNLAVNTTAGAANGMSIETRADESSGIRLVQTSTTYNTSPVTASDPPNIASAGTLVSGRGGGLNIVGANGPVRTYSGGAGTATTSVSSTGLAVTGTLDSTSTATVNSANSTSVALVVKGETGNGIRQRFIGQAASGQYNWQIGASVTVAGNFEIIPSTAVDGTTFSTPVGKFSTTGLAVTGSLNATASSGTVSLLTQTGATGYGLIIVPGADTVYDAFTINNAANTLNKIRMFGDGSATFSGNLGIGTSSPTTKLQIGTGTTAMHIDPVVMGLSTNVYYNGSTYVMDSGSAMGSLFQPGNGDFAFRRFTTSAVGSYSMYIDTSGNVGIGTSSPAYTLEVATGTSGQQSLASFRTADSTTANNAGIQIFATPSSTATSRSTYIMWDADGANASGSDYFYIQKLGNSGQVDLIQQSAAAMTFQTSGTERARIDSAGVFQAGTIQASGTAVGSFSASKWFIQSEDSQTTRAYYTGPDASTKGSWEIYAATSTGSAVLAGRFNASANFVAQNIGLGATIPTTSGTGITFPATQSASTDANTLDDYEEGTWEPNQGGNLTVIGAFSSSGTYTKIGRLVTFRGVVSGATSIAVNANGVICTNFSFSAATIFTGTIMNDSATSSGGIYINGVTVVATTTIAATPSLYFSATCFV